MRNVRVVWVYYLFNYEKPRDSLFLFFYSYLLVLSRFSLSLSRHSSLSCECMFFLLAFWWVNIKMLH